MHRVATVSKWNHHRSHQVWGRSPSLAAEHQLRKVITTRSSKYVDSEWLHGWSLWSLLFSVSIISYMLYDTSYHVMSCWGALTFASAVGFGGFDSTPASCFSCPSSSSYLQGVFLMIAQPPPTPPTSSKRQITWQISWKKVFSCQNFLTDCSTAESKMDILQWGWP